MSSSHLSCARRSMGNSSVAHAQARVSAALTEGLRPAPILHEEPLEALFGALPILGGVHGPEQIVLPDLRIETRDDPVEGFHATYRFIHTCWLHADFLYCWGLWPM